MKIFGLTKILLLFALLNFYVFCIGTRVSAMIEQAIQENSWEIFEDLINSAEMNGFFSQENVLDFFATLQSQKWDLVISSESLGKSLENRDIMTYCLTSNQPESPGTKKGIAVMTVIALHHAREPLSLTMILFTILRVIIGYRKGEKGYKNLLKENKLCFIPFINIDGYNHIEEIYRTKHHLAAIRKNRRSNGCNFDEGIGVDLNRNYPFDWSDTAGSSSNRCDEDYGGPQPFSEPETQAFRDFIDRNKNEIALVLNLHAYGNLWIYPYACCRDDDKMKSLRVKSIYSDFKSKAPLPSHAKVGNAWETIRYLASGDASDWILKTYALSPELGITAPQSETFFPKKDVLYGFVQQDYLPIWYLLSKLNFEVEAGRLIAEQILELNSTRYTQSFFNRSYKRLQNFTVILSIEPIDPQHPMEIPRISLLQTDVNGNIVPKTKDFPIPQITRMENYNILNWTFGTEIESWTFANLSIELINTEENLENLEIDIQVKDSNTLYFHKTYGTNGISFKHVARRSIPLIAGLIIAITFLIFLKGLYSKYKNKEIPAVHEFRTHDDDNMVEIVTFSAHQVLQNPISNDSEA